MEEVTFKMFARLGSERGWTVEMLAERFQDRIERPGEFFERALSCKWKNSGTGRYEDRSGVVIPYRSILQFYLTELDAWQKMTGQSLPITDAQKKARSITAENMRQKRLQQPIEGLIAT